MAPFLILTLLGLAQAIEPLESWRLEKTLNLKADLHHVQGVDVEGNIAWVSSVDAKAGKGYLSRFDLDSGKLLDQVEVQNGAWIHPGGIMLDGNSIWVPVAEYKRDSSTNVQRRNKKTLQLEQTFEVKDHIGCIAVRKKVLVGASWDARTIYEWTRGGAEKSKRKNPLATAWQDIKFDGDKLVGGGLVDKKRGVVEWISWPSMKVERQIEVHRTDRGVLYSHEGMAIRAGKLYFVPEDSPSRLFVFAR